MRILVSACLLGCRVKYNGQSNKALGLIEFLADHEVIPVCPELLGGLPTPRLPAEIVDGKQVVNQAGEDLTPAFERGAEQTLYLARLLKADVAVLKENSPSCGSRQIYDGSFSGIRIPGKGRTAHRLAAEGLRVFSEENYEDILN